MTEKFILKQRKIIIDVSIKTKSEISKFKFIIDTGASHSIIDINAMKAFGYTRKDFTKTEILRGFNGKTSKVHFIKAKSLQSLGLIRQNFELGLIEFSPFAFYDGILGLDFFMNHKLCIDFKKGIVELEK